MTSRTGSARRILGDFEKVSWWSWVLPQKKTAGFRLLKEALGRCQTIWGGVWKSQNRKIVPLSPYVEKPLNSKVIKSFVPELRSCYMFLYFEIPMFNVIYIYIYMLCPFRISVSGYGIQIPLEKVWIPISSWLWVNLYYYCFIWRV